VVDGDTLDFSGTRVRLFGIDAPETKQSCKAAKGAEYMCGEWCLRAEDPPVVQQFALLDLNLRGLWQRLGR
jgi:hypothetical protein